MANKVGFGITELNLIGSSGTPKIDSPNNLNINAVNVAISTNVTVGGNLDVDGHTELDDINVSGVSTFAGNLKVGSGVTITPAGNADFVGVITAYKLESEDRIQTGSGSFYGGSYLMFLGGNGSDMNYYSGGTSYSTHKFNHLQGGSSIETFRISQSGVNITGIATVGNFVHVGSGVTISSSGDIFIGGIKVGSGVTISSSGDIFNTGITTNAKQIVGLATNNVIPFLYNNYSDLPSASTYHGAFAHVHGAGKAYFAHAAAWYELVHVDNASHTVGLGTEKYNVGILTATSIKVGTGVTVSSDGDSFVTGISTATKFVGDLSDAVTSRWSVSNSGASAYRFTGPGGLDGTADNSTIYLARGQTYEFNVNASGHPFQIRVSNGGSAYNTGVTNNGAQVGVVKFEVPFAAPNTLVYQCTSHSGMVGNIVVYPSI